MWKSLIILALLASVFVAGCTEKVQDNSMDSTNTQEKSAILEATELEQINASLEKGPVLLKIGAEWCEECQNIMPILAQVKADYGDKVTVMSLDIDRSPELANYFGISVIPDSSVIIGIENGEYIYMKEDGNISTDRFKARILKIEGKEVYEHMLDLALHKEAAKSE